MAFLILAASGILSLVLMNLLNRKEIHRITEAKKALQLRAALLEPRSIDGFLNKSNVKNENKLAAHILFSCLSEILKVNPEQVAEEYCLSYLLVYEYNDNANKNCKKLEPFSYDLVEKLALICNKKNGIGHGKNKL